MVKHTALCPAAFFPSSLEGKLPQQCQSMKQGCAPCPPLSTSPRPAQLPAAPCSAIHPQASSTGRSSGLGGRQALLGALTRAIPHAEGSCLADIGPYFYFRSREPGVNTWALEGLTIFFLIWSPALPLCWQFRRFPIILIRVFNHAASISKITGFKQFF